MGTKFLGKIRGPATRISRRFSTGISLIEVLITIVVLGVGILGLGRTQIAGLNATHGASLQNGAAMYLQDMAERMRANPEGVRRNAYAIDSSVSAPSNVTCATSSGCSASDRARQDVYQWISLLSANRALPGGIGKISCDNASTSNAATSQTCVVSVLWNSKTKLQDGGYTCMIPIAAGISCASIRLLP
jgi:type IV pilus assembly protein PilV